VAIAKDLGRAAESSRWITAGAVLVGKIILAARDGKITADEVIDIVDTAIRALGADITIEP
jgi:hypothetical protein